MFTLAVLLTRRICKEIGVFGKKKNISIPPQDKRLSTPRSGTPSSGTPSSSTPTSSVLSYYQTPFLEESYREYLNQFFRSKQQVLEKEQRTWKSQNADIHRKTMQLFRKLIREQIKAFKRNNFRADWSRCSICGTIIQAENLSVDHSIVPFVSIFNQFFIENNLAEKMVFDLFHRSKNQTNMAALQRTDTIKKKWREFHKKKAYFALACIRCNNQKNHL